MELAKTGLLLAKIESTYGTDPSPVQSANIIAAARGQVTLTYPSEKIYRDLLDGTFNKYSGVNALPSGSIKFRTEVRGNRTDGTTADCSKGNVANLIEIDPLLQACDLAPTYTAESGVGNRDGYVTYVPTVPSNEGSSVTFYLYSQKKLYKMTGSKGNIASLNLEAGKFGYIDWEFNGLFLPITDSSIPGSQTWLATKPPQFQQPAAYTAQSVTADASTDKITLTSHTLLNGDLVKFGGSGAPGGLTLGTWYFVVSKATNDFKVAATLGGSAIDLTTAGTAVTVTSMGAMLFDDWNGAVFNKLEFKLGNTIARREDAQYTYGVRGHVVTDRLTKCSLNPESIAEATHPLWADWLSSRNKVLYAQIGTQTGNKCMVKAKVEIDTINYTDDSGKRIQSIDGTCVAATPGDSGGSDFSLRFF